jgi:hypothetical protein
MAANNAKWPQTVPNFSIPRPSKSYQNCDFGTKMFRLANLNFKRQLLRKTLRAFQLLCNAAMLLLWR